ncbi:hypothetical protein ACFJ9Q_001214 [Vibrio parahaemolyticus]|nr:hypothetical protein [Vibrio parahaemolyticus]
MIKLIRELIVRGNKCLSSFDSEINEAKLKQAKEHEQMERKLLESFNSKHNTSLKSLDQTVSYLEAQESSLKAKKLLADMDKHTEFLKNG